MSHQLPTWLANPHLIEDDLSTYTGIEDSIKGMDSIILNNLAQMGIKNLFPVQHHIVPIILNEAKFGLGPCNYPPSDLCVSAPTGSGKTLAFAMPLVQCLLSRVVQETRALILLPTRELASQVAEVFLTLCEGTSLNCVLLCGGNMNLKEEQRQLFKFRNGQRFQADIIVATPGRLVEHLTGPNLLALDHLRFLVLDEADRILSQIKNNWLEIVEASVYKTRKRAQKVTAASANQPLIPLQKLLFSATLSGDPERLEMLNLFHPRLFTANSKPNHKNAIALTRYVTPALLKEYMIVVHSKNKPLAVLDLLCKSDSKVLCFTGSIENTTRLAHLIQLFAKEYGFKENYSCVEFSSQMGAKNRNTIMKQFKNGDINVLVSSDSMARGIDVPNISTVILYDVPTNVEAYIHRVGRTARAGRSGTAYTIVLPTEAFGFKKMLKSVGKSIPKKSISANAFKELLPVYKNVLPSLRKSLKRKIS